MRYRFGDYELDATSHRLLRGGVALRVWPKVFDVLRYLVEQRGRTVSKQELLDTLWSDSHVDEVAVPWTISHARRALGQPSGQKHPIETVHGRGYCFTADVEVLDDRPATSNPPPSLYPADSGSPAQPFVGRDTAMQRLEARLTEAHSGHGGLCVLSGPAGIGKTRCVDELSARAAQQGFRVVFGRSVEDAWAPVYWPWIQVVRSLVRDQPQLATAGNELLTRLGSVESDTREPEDASQGAEDNFWWIDGVSQLLIRESRRQPMLVVLDDLHWADAATVDLLAFLAPDLRQAPLLIVVTQRDGREVLHPRALQRLSRHADRIALSALSVQDVGDYLRLVTKEQTVSPELEAAVHVATAGNPLFLQQTVRGLMATHGGAGLAALSPTEVKPASIARDVLGASLRVLETEARDLLSLASVLGESFPVTLLQQLSGHAIDELLGVLESARNEGLLIAEEPITFRFCHALLRSVLYESLPSDQRVIHHRRVAEILERTGASSREIEIAHHYYASLPLGDAPRVTAAVLRAARVAARMNAFADANRYCEWARASQALDTEARPRERAELLLFSAQMQFSAGRADEAQQSIEALIAVARPHRFHDLLVRAARILRHTPLMGAIEDPLALQILEDALDHAPPGPNALRVEAMSLLSWVPPYALDLERSKALSAEALELARRVGDETLELRALNARLYSLSGPDDIDALLATAEEMLARSTVPTGWVCAAALGARYMAYLHRGDMALADQTCAELGRAARTHQWPAAIWYHERLVAQRRFLDGDFQATAAAIPELLDRGRRLRVSYAPMLVELLQGLLLLETQGPSLVTQTAGDGQLRAGLATGPINVRPSIARLLLVLGDREPARQLLQQLAENDFANVPKEVGYLHALCSLAVIAVALDDRLRAETLYTLLLPYAHFNTPNVALYYEGSVSHFLAMLAVYLDKPDPEVTQHFETALAMNEQLGQNPQLTRTREAYARYLTP